MSTPEVPRCSRADRLRDGWLASEGRRRLHVRGGPALRRRRRPLGRRPRRAAKGVVVGLRPSLRERVLRRRGRRGAPRPRHPGRVRHAGGAHADVVLRGRGAGCGGRRRHHGQPQPVDRQRVQGEVADRRCGRTGDPRGDRGDDRGNGWPRRVARSPTPRRPGWSSGSTPSTDTSGSSRARSTSSARRPTSRLLVEPLYGSGAGWIARLLAGGRARHRAAPGAEPLLRRREPRADPPEHRRGARVIAAAGTTSACFSTGTRTGPAPPTSAARSSTSCRSTACSCTTCSSTAGCAARRVHRERDVDGRRLASGTACRPRDVGRVRVRRPEDDRDRRDDGRRGIRRLRVRHAPAGARRDLRRPPPPRPVPSRARRRSLAGVAASSTSTRSPARLLPARRHPRRPGALPGAQGAAHGRARAKAPTALAGEPVARTETLSTDDGFKFWIADGTWLLVRVSGTEPLVRVYTEASRTPSPMRSWWPASGSSEADPRGSELAPGGPGRSELPGW